MFLYVACKEIYSITYNYCYFYIENISFIILSSLSHKPIEANISSMSFWLSGMMVWGEVSEVALFWPSSPDADKSLLFLRLFKRFSFALVFKIKLNLNRRLIDWKRLLRGAFLLTAADEQQVLGTGSWGHKAQQTSCPKVLNFFWTLRKKATVSTTHV